MEDPLSTIEGGKVPGTFLSPFQRHEHGQPLDGRPASANSPCAWDVTVTAGDASADVIVFSGSALPTGTVVWSAPGDGSGVSKILPAVPSSTGVADVFAYNTSHNVQAITADGKVVWTANVGTGGLLLPDFQGGLVVDDGSTIKKLDGVAGQTLSQYSYSYYPRTNTGIHTDGTIFTVDGDALVGINPTTGLAKFSIPLEHSTWNFSGGCMPSNQWDDYPRVGRLVIAGDGYAYLFYEYNDGGGKSFWGPLACDTTTWGKQHDRLLRVSPDGTALKIVIADWSRALTGTTVNWDWQQIVEWTQDGTLPGGVVEYATLVTNGDSGVMLALNYYLPAYWSVQCLLPPGNSGYVPREDVHRLLAISGDNIVSDVTLNLGTPYDNPVVPILQAQDGTYFGTGFSATPSLDAFDQYGDVKWTVPGFTPVMATADGGVIGESSTDQYVTFNQNGVATGMLAEFPQFSWKGAYRLGSAESVAPPRIRIAASFLAVGGGNFTGNGTADKPHTVGLFWCGTGYGGSGSCGNDPDGGTDLTFGYSTDPGNNSVDFVDFSADHPSWVDLVESEAKKTLREAFRYIPVLADNLRAGENADHTIYVRGAWPAASENGITPLGQSTMSKVYYLPIMGNSEIALGAPPQCQDPPCAGWNNFTPVYPPSTPADEGEFQTLMRAMGKGIGNTAAHELGHQIFPALMDCGPTAAGASRACDYNNEYVYEFFSGSGQQYTGLGSSGGQFFYVDVPGQVLHWQPSSQNCFNQFFIPNFPNAPPCGRW